MAGTKSVHECLFCSQIFDSASAKDDHILEHFAHETCLECNRDLLRIGSTFYTKHDTTTCVKQAVKTEEHIESCFTQSLIIQNDSECVSDNLRCADNLSYVDACPWENNDHSKTEQQNTFEDLSNLIDYQSYIPDLQWGESREHPVSSSISAAPEQLYSFGEPNVKMEPLEQNNEQRTFAMRSFTAQKSPERDDKPVEDSEKKSFTCEICERKTASKAALNRHKILLHSPDKIFCNVCGKLFTDAATRDVHRIECTRIERLRKSTKSSNDVRCEACNTKFKSDAIYRQHMRRRHGLKANFKCDQCEVVFMKKVALENHHCSNQSTESRDEKSNACNICGICGKTFNHKSSVYRHKLLLHTPAEVIICNVCGRRFDDCDARDVHREQCALKARLRKSASSGELECNYCQKKFRLDESLRRHIRIKHDSNVEKFRCPLCSAVFMKESSLQAHICPKSSEHPCDICGRKLSNARTLQTHKILLHSEPGTIFCNVCSKLFSTVEERDKHKLECSLRSKMYKLKSYGRFECDICHIKVGTKGNLRQHMRRKHDPNSEDFRCKSCRTIFMNSTSLEHHRCKGKPTNASQRLLISCELCGKVLQKCALSRHKLLMHRAPDSIFCRTCVKIFPSIDDLDAHLPQCKKSIKRQCNVCGKVLANPRVLARHKVSLHSAPGTIFCKTCVKKFKTIEELNAHMPECTLKRKLQKFQKQSQMSEDKI